MSLGKLIYFLIFIIFRVHLFLTFGTKIKCWCRNSIYESYFAFLKSDLDITIWIENEASFLKVIQKIQSISSYYFIIKEINFYLAGAPLSYNQLINPLELKRDPILEHKLGKKITDFSDAQRQSYLLRMYFAEKNTDAPTLSARSMKKWNYHLKRALVNYQDFKIQTYQELFELILRNFFKDRSDRFIKATSELNSKIAPHEIFEKSQFQNELMTLFPEKFCFAINNFQFSPDDCDRVLIVEQIKWEVWAMMTQPWLFSNHTETTFRHLENLKEVALVVEPQGELATQIESLSVYMQEVLSIS
jgi:hypothetical protein